MESLREVNDTIPIAEKTNAATRRLRCHASFSAELVLPPDELDRLLQLQHLAWLACDIIQRCNALASENRSNDREHSSPRSKKWVRCIQLLTRRHGAYVHYIVKHHECSSSCLLFIPYSYLPDAPITSKQVIQVFASNLIIQVLDKEYTIRTRR